VHPKVARLSLVLSIALLAGAVGGCGSSGPARPDPGTPSAGAGVSIDPSDRPFLVSPTIEDGSPREDRLAEGFLALVDRGDTDEAAAVAAELLEVDRTDLAAATLAAQTRFADLRAGGPGDLAAVRDALAELLPEVPPSSGEGGGNPAARLLYGRVSDLLGDVVEAYDAFRTTGAWSTAAAARADELEERALEVVGNRFREAVERDRLEPAGEALERLRRWAPEAPLTLEAEVALAVVRQDRSAELVALTRLLETPERSDDRELLERRADLELDVGEPSDALVILEDLAYRYPEDEDLTDRLERAKFRWRLGQLPPEVSRAAARPELDRAGFATLVYWLVPGVRRARTSEGRIAADILEHPRRTEIARVVNLGLLSVDPTLHRFSPDRPIRRGTALAALLATLESATCRDDHPLGSRPSTEAVCAAAESCRLTTDVGACLPDSSLSGSDALEMIRRAIQAMG
jgi:hypothetical protein